MTILKKVIFNKGQQQTELEIMLYCSFIEQPTQLAFTNASTVNRLIGTEGEDLLIECIAVGGKTAPTLSLVVLGTTVQTGVHELKYVLRNIPRIYDTTNVSCKADSDALGIPMTTTTLIFLNRRY